jgi:pilus assembly protein FimV
MMQPGELAGLAAGFDPSATQDVTADSGVGRPLAEEGAAAAPDFTLNIPAGGALATAEPDLTLDAPGPDEMTQTNANLDAGAGGNMIDFNFDSTAMTAPTPEASTAPELPAFAPNETVVMTPENQENAAGLNIDFEMGKTGKVEDAGLVLPDLNLELPSDLTTSAAPAAEPLLPELRLDDISLNFDEPPKVDAAPAPAAAEGGVKDDRWYDVQTKFDLAKAYQEMGDKDGAREILQEVIKEGDSAQQSEAKALLDSLA